MTRSTKINFICFFFIGLLFCTEFISNFGAVDKIGPQWFYLSLANLTIFFYYLRYKFKLNLNDLLYSKTFICYLIFLFFCTISIFFSQNKFESVNYFSRIILVFVTFINFYILLEKINKKNIVYIITFLFVFEGLAVFLQFLDLYEFGKIFGRNAKLIGFSANINIAGFSIALTLPFALSLFCQLNGLKKFILSTFIIISVFSAFMTGSRGATLSITIIFVSFFIYSVIFEKGFKNKLKEGFFILTPFIVTIFVTEILFDTMRYSYRMNQIVERGSNSRLKYYNDAFDSVKENPLTGIGIGNWKINSIDKGKRHIEGYIVPYHAHNDYIQILTETGIFGLISYIFIFIFSITNHLKKFFIHKSPLILSCFLFLFVYLIDSNLNFPIARPIMQIKLAFILAFLVRNEK